MSLLYDEVYQRLLAAYGPKAGWPGESPLEVTVGVVLSHKTTWRNVERALINLKEAGSLSVPALYQLGDEALEELIKPAGSSRQKARRLKNLMRHIVEQHEGSLESLFAADPQSVRDELLTINGIGPETADLLTLYAARLPAFPVEAGTARVLMRHGWIEFGADYHAIKEFVESNLVHDVVTYQQFHALLARVATEHCRKQPICESCPLRDFLPESGPLEPDVF